MTSQIQTELFLLSDVIMDVIEKMGADIPVCSEFLTYFVQKRFYLTRETWVRVFESVEAISTGNRLFATTRSLGPSDMDHIAGICEFLGERSTSISSEAWWEILAYHNAVKGSKYSDPHQPLGNIRDLLLPPSGFLTAEELEAMLQATPTVREVEKRSWNGLEFLNSILPVEGWTVLVALAERLERDSLTEEEIRILFKAVYNSRSRLQDIAVLDKSTLEDLLECKSSTTTTERKEEILDLIEARSYELLNLLLQSCSVEPPLA